MGWLKFQRVKLRNWLSFGCDSTLTALAAVLAFIPLTLDSFWGPLAYVLIGGVAVGTVITLLFVPALYAMWFRIQAPSSTGTP